MKKSFLVNFVTLGMALILTACGRNSATEISDNIADKHVENQTDIQEETETYQMRQYRNR